MSTPHVVVVMGVAGTGKTTIGPLLADRLGVPYAEGDDFHPEANIEKMSAGTPLTDEDRWPWLDAIGRWAHGTCRTRRCGQQLRPQAQLPRPARAAAPGVVFVHLTGDRALIEDRMSHRQGHYFMPTALLDSQFATLQPLAVRTSAGVDVDVAGSPEEITDRAVTALTALSTPPVPPTRSRTTPRPPPLPLHVQGKDRDQSQRRDAGSGHRRADHLRGPRPARDRRTRGHRRHRPSSSRSSSSIAFLAPPSARLALRACRRGAARQGDHQLLRGPRLHGRRCGRPDRAGRDPRQAARRLRRRRPDRRHDLARAGSPAAGTTPWAMVLIASIIGLPLFFEVAVASCR